MLIDTKIDIKVALIGYVSVGKTTVLNALFRDKYGEVAMGRATASVNHYCVSVSTTTTDPVLSRQSQQEPDELDDSSLTASAILAKTIQDNARLRSSDTVEEAWFDVMLDKPLCKMRDDARLVVVDVPGINEAGTSSKYKDYVVNQWHTFDCVVVVMDGRQGVNTEEQVELLKFVNSNCNNIKSVPVIILCNKIEDPDEGEQSALLMETRQAVQKIFLNKNHTPKFMDAKSVSAQLEATLEAAAKTRDRGTAPFPPLILLPVSAIHAFIYQAGSRCGLEKFQHFFGKDLIEKIGKDNFGKKWRHLDPQQKLEQVYEVLSDSAQCQEGFDLSNFDKFIALLSYCVGGKETQKSLMKAQIDVALSRLTPSLGVNLIHDFQTIYTRSKALNLPVEDLPSHFWSVFHPIADNAFSLFKSPKDVDVVAMPMGLILSYAQFAQEVGWKHEIEKIKQHAQGLVMRQIMLVVNQFDYGLEVSPSHLVFLYGALLLQSNEAFFYQNFGLLKIIMEDRARVASINSQSNNKCSIVNCDGKMQPLPGHLIKIWKCSRCRKYATEWGSKICPQKYMSVQHNNHGYDRHGGSCAHCNAQTPKSDVSAIERCDKCLRLLETKCVGTTPVKWCSSCSHWYTSSSVNVCVGTIANQNLCDRIASELSYCSNPIPKYNLVGNRVLKPVVEFGAEETVWTIPDSLENPEHFGHLIWTYGRIVKLLGVEQNQFTKIGELSTSNEATVGLSARPQYGDMNNKS